MNKHLEGSILSKKAGFLREIAFKIQAYAHTLDFQAIALFENNPIIEISRDDILPMAFTCGDYTVTIIRKEESTDTNV